MCRRWVVGNGLASEYDKNKINKHSSFPYRKTFKVIFALFFARHEQKMPVTLVNEKYLPFFLSNAQFNEIIISESIEICFFEE